MNALLQVDLWFWKLDQPEADTQALAAHLSEDERDRAARFFRASDSAGFKVGRGRLREILGDYTGRRPSDLCFRLLGRNKPILPGGPAFNLSHSGGWAALAVAPNAPDLQLGIDIEANRPVEPALPRRVLSPRELQDLDALPADEWMAGFFNAWTRKEAIIKATGDGFGADLRGFDITLAPNEPARVRDSRGALPPAKDWDLVALETGKTIHGALAAVTGGGKLGPIVVRQGALPLEP